MNIVRGAHRTPSHSELSEVVEATASEIDTVAVDDDSSKFHEVRLPPDEPQIFAFPNSLSHPDTVYFKWEEHQTLGTVAWHWASALLLSAGQLHNIRKVRNRFLCCWLWCRFLCFPRIEGESAVFPPCFHWA